MVNRHGFMDRHDYLSLKFNGLAILLVIIITFLLFLFHVSFSNGIINFCVFVFDEV
jgi:hypothetical protein